MQKIPTLFLRDPNNRSKVTDEVNPECQWVLDGEGIATRKYDGTCMLLDDRLAWWSRREVKNGKPIPENFVEVNYDKTTGKRMGWVPFHAQGYLHPFLEAIGSKSVDNMDILNATLAGDYIPGTYELCGPKINGNPEGFKTHELIRHAAYKIDRYEGAPPLTAELIKSFVSSHSEAFGWEGLVWHNPDGRMAKLKARDL